MSEAPKTRRSSRFYLGIAAVGFIGGAVFLAMLRAGFDPTTVKIVALAFGVLSALSFFWNRRNR